MEGRVHDAAEYTASSYGPMQESSEVAHPSRTSLFLAATDGHDQCIMSLPSEPDVAPVAKLRDYQVKAAQRIESPLLRDAQLAVLKDKERWKWLREMNRISLESAPRRQLLPNRPAPPSIDVAA